MYKHKLFLLPVAWLLAFMALACAPPDDDDRSSGPSGPAITSASYDVGTALLTVQGSNLSPTTATQAQIQTIRVGSRTNGVALDSYTADDPATGPDSNGLAKGKYRIKSDGTKLWLKLKDADKATLNGKPGMNKDGLKKGLLSVSTGAWAGLNTAKDLTVRNIPAAEEVDDQSRKQTEDEQVEQTEEVEDKQSKVSDDNQPSKQTEEAEQDEQAEQVEEESPKAAITGASYHVGTALLTLQGSNLSATTATQAQIQTITVDGLALSSYTADATATGADSRGLAKGKYRLHSAGTALWLKLTDQHKATLNGKTGMDSNGLKDGLLSVGTGAWAGLNTAKALAVSGNPAPAITSATYNVGTALLTVQGTDLGSATQAQIQTITVDGVALSSYTATATGADSRSLVKGKYRIKNDGTALWLKLTDTDKATLNGKTGMDSNGLKDGLLTSTGTWAGLNTAKALAVSGHPPAITSASYNVATGVLVITGTNLPSTVNSWDFSKLRFVAGNGDKSGPLFQRASTKHSATGSAASATSLTITLGGSEKRKADKILVKNGDSDDNGAYNLEAAAGFAGGSAADTGNNPITVSGYVSQISSVQYSDNGNIGILEIYGSGLPTTVEEWDFNKLTIVSGDGSNRYTLPQHETAGENRATGLRASRIRLIITLRGSVKAEADKILVKNGNLEAATGFVTGSPADLKNAITLY